MEKEYNSSKKPESPVQAAHLAYIKGIVSKNLFKERSKKRLTQGDIAVFLGMTTSGYGDYERGRCPEGHVLYALAEFYGISIASFFVDLDKEGNVLNEQQVKGAIENPIEGIADALKVLAGNAQADKLALMETRIKSLEETVRLLISGN